MRAHFEMGLDISPRRPHQVCLGRWHATGTCCALAVGDEEWASRVYSDFQVAV